MSRVPPDPTNAAAVRVYDAQEARARDQAVPPRSATLDAQIRELVEREEEIDRGRGRDAAARKGLAAAQRVTPAVNEVAAAEPKTDDNLDLSIFEDLLLAGPADETHEKNDDNEADPGC